MVNMSTDTIKLLPCPFCGGEIEILPKGYGLLYGRCMNGCFVSGSENSKNYLIEKLNTRKPMQEIVKKLEEECEAYRNSDWLLRDKAIKVGTMNTAMDIVKEVGGMNES